MKMQRLLTSSLLDSFDWLQKAPTSWQERARNEFIDTIRRIPKKIAPEYCQRGIDFEDLVCKSGATTELDFAAKVREVYAERIAKDPLVAHKEEVLKQVISVATEVWRRAIGAEQQTFLEYEFALDGEQYKAYGYSDLLFPNRVEDIKTCSKFRDEKKYTNRIQHSVYMLAADVKNFHYLVADYRNGNYPLAYHQIDLTDADLSHHLERLRGKTRNMLAWLVAHNLLDDYLQYFCTKTTKGADK